MVLQWSDLFSLVATFHLVRVSGVAFFFILKISPQLCTDDVQVDPVENDGFAQDGDPRPIFNLTNGSIIARRPHFGAMLAPWVSGRGSGLGNEIAWLRCLEPLKHFHDCWVQKLQKHTIEGQRDR